MKKIVLLAIALLLVWLATAQAQVWVDPYLRRDGIQVQGHDRSNRDGNISNNYSYPGNINPYTGKQATGDPSRYLQQHQNQNTAPSDERNPYQINPYQFRW